MRFIRASDGDSQVSRTCSSLIFISEIPSRQDCLRFSSSLYWLMTRPTDFHYGYIFTDVPVFFYSLPQVLHYGYAADAMVPRY